MRVCPAFLLLFISVSITAQMGDDPSVRSGTLVVRILDQATGLPTQARVRLTDASGSAVVSPRQAVGVAYGREDQEEGFAFQPDSAFYVSGHFDATLPEGQYDLMISKGNEYLPVRETLQIASGEVRSDTFALHRWINMPLLGWYSADGHIHMKRSPEQDRMILDWTRGEDIHIGNLLWMGDYQTTYFAQYAFGAGGTYQEGKYLITAGQEEPRTVELGHALGLGAEEPVRYPEAYYYFDKVFDRIRELGGVAGYAHFAEAFHAHRGLVLDGLRGKVDVVEIMQSCGSGGPLVTSQYYTLLDLGFRVTAVAGSDFPYCGKGHTTLNSLHPPVHARIGDVRFYTYTGDTLTYDLWREHLRTGNTFVTNGPVMQFMVNGAIPGETIHVSKGDSLTIEVFGYGQQQHIPLESVTIIAHGEPLATSSSGDPGQSTASIHLVYTIPADHGIWIAAKVQAGEDQFAHCTPVYVSVDGSDWHNPKTALTHLDQCETYLREIEDVISRPGGFPIEQAWKYKEGLQARVDETQQVIDNLRVLFSAR